MSNIYFLRVMTSFNRNEENHYENVFSNMEKALEVGKEELEKMFRYEYKNTYDDDKQDNLPELTREQLFSMSGLYTLSITEFDPEYYESLSKIENLPKVDFLDLNDNYTMKLKPAKIEYCFDYEGNKDYIIGIFVFNYKGKILTRKIMMNYDDYINPKAGMKFKVRRYS